MSEYKTFTSTKNYFNAGLIATHLVIKNIVFTPIRNLYKLTNNKLALINSNELLLNNGLIDGKTIYFNKKSKKFFFLKFFFFKKKKKNFCFILMKISPNFHGRMDWLKF